jgi:hypothetical protein
VGAVIAGLPYPFLSSLGLSLAVYLGGSLIEQPRQARQGA